MAGILFVFVAVVVFAVIAAFVKTRNDQKTGNNIYYELKTEIESDSVHVTGGTPADALYKAFDKYTDRLNEMDPCHTDDIIAEMESTLSEMRKRYPNSDYSYYRAEIDEAKKNHQEAIDQEKEERARHAFENQLCILEDNFADLIEWSGDYDDLDTINQSKRRAVAAYKKCCEIAEQHHYVNELTDMIHGWTGGMDFEPALETALENLKPLKSRKSAAKRKITAMVKSGEVKSRSDIYRLFQQEEAEMITSAYNSLIKEKKLVETQNGGSYEVSLPPPASV